MCLRNLNALFFDSLCEFCFQDDVKDAAVVVVANGNGDDDEQQATSTGPLISRMMRQTSNNSNSNNNIHNNGDDHDNHSNDNSDDVGFEKLFLKNIFCLAFICVVNWKKKRYNFGTFMFAFGLSTKPV